MLFAARLVSLLVVSLTGLLFILPVVLLDVGFVVFAAQQPPPAQRREIVYQWCILGGWFSRRLVFSVKTLPGGFPRSPLCPFIVLCGLGLAPRPGP